MQKLSERTAGFTDSLIRRMTRISLRYGAVNLSQGFPDFEPPREILDRLAQVAHEDFHQYSVTWGAQNFREALAEKQSRKSDWTGFKASMKSGMKSFLLSKTKRTPIILPIVVEIDC